MKKLKSQSHALLTHTRLILVVISLACATTGTAAELNQPPKGFKALFNGKDLTGWKGL